MPLTQNDRRKYSSIAAFHRCVAHVKGVSAAEARFLFALAVDSDYRTGIGHPGNRALSQGCGGVSRQAILKTAHRLIAKHLIEIVTLGSSRAMATAYRICLEDERFPDPKPTTPEVASSPEKPTTSEVAGLRAEPTTSRQETDSLRVLNRQPEPSEPTTSEVAHVLKLRSSVRSKNHSEAEATAATAEVSLSPDPRQTETPIRDQAFASIGMKPVGSEKFKTSWERNFRNHGVSVESMENVIQEVGSQRVPPPFFQAKRRIESSNGNGHAPCLLL